MSEIAKAGLTSTEVKVLQWLRTTKNPKIYILRTFQIWESNKQIEMSDQILVMI